MGRNLVGLSPVSLSLGDTDGVTGPAVGEGLRASGTPMTGSGSLI